MSELKPFEIKVAGYELSLQLGHCVCVLFRTQQEVDYLAVQMEEERTLRIFNNVELVRWMAGLALHQDGTPYQVAADDRLFYDEYGWNPATIIKIAPSEDELELWLDVNARDIDKEWQNGIE